MANAILDNNGAVKPIVANESTFGNTKTAKELEDGDTGGKEPNTKGNGADTDAISNNDGIPMAKDSKLGIHIALEKEHEEHAF